MTPGGRELSLAVVGLDFPNERGPGEQGGSRRFELALMRPGDPVFLRREPRNPADPRAVAVFSERGARIGYLTAERCGWIGARIDRGEPVSAVLQHDGAGAQAAYIRVRLGGGDPTLPMRDERPRDRPDVEPVDDGWPG